MKYRVKVFRPAYFSDLRYQPQYRYRLWPFWFNGPSFRYYSEATKWIDEFKSKDYPRYFDVD